MVRLKAASFGDTRQSCTTALSGQCSCFGASETRAIGKPCELMIDNNWKTRGFKSKQFDRCLLFFEIDESLTDDTDY